MNKYLLGVLLSISIFGVFLYASAQEGPVLTATLDSQTAPAKNIDAGSQNVDVARITLTASGGDVYMNGIYLAADGYGGLSNFTNLYVYDTYNGQTLMGTYPSQNEIPNLIQFSAVRIGSGQSKTYLVRASLAPNAAGQVRIGFSGFTFATQAVPTLSGVPVYGNTMTLPGATPTPTPTASATPTPIATPSQISTPEFTSLAALGLKEGDTISAAGSSDPDIYIVNDWGYKRLFLNPVIFSFYGHLGGFANVKNVTLSTRDTLLTSGLFRNCESNDPRVYGLEVTGEDTSKLHWVNTTGAQAVADDPAFFKKVFCINNNEFNWYQKGVDYTSVSQIPRYSR